MMVRRPLAVLALFVFSMLGLPHQLVTAAEKASPQPLKVLIVAGGCCHDYDTQTKLLKKGIEARVHAAVEVIYNPDTTVKARFPIYESDGWARDFDVIIHDECSAGVTERPYVDRILKAAADCDLPCVIDAEVVKEDNVFPMIPAGAPLSGMIIEKPKEQMAKPTGST